MNEQLQAFARETLKESLSSCTEAQQHLFKQMYSYQDLKKPIDQVVDDMPEEKLDWAMQQVENTLRKR